MASADPAIRKSVCIEPGPCIWISTAYGVASTVMMPLWGKLSDPYGRKRTILSGVILLLKCALHLARVDWVGAQPPARVRSS